MDFGKRKPVALFNVMHDPKNPLNWFERMRQRQQQKPSLLNANVGQIHRTIETREQLMVARSGSGDQRAVGKLAAMNDVEYYKTRSGVLNLSRSDPVLIKKVREASVPDNSMVSGLDAEVKKEVLEGGDGSEGGSVEGEVASVGSEERAEGAPMIGGGASSSAGAPTTIVVPEALKQHDVLVANIPAPTGGAYEADKTTLSLPKLVAKYGPVPNAPLSLLTAVALGDIPSNGFIAKKSADYIRDVFKVEIGSRKFFELLKYEGTGEASMTEEEYEAGRSELYARHPSYKPSKPLAQSKKELDELLGKAKEKEGKDLIRLIEDANARYIMDNALEPFKSGDREIVRTGLNKLLTDMAGAVRLVNDKRPDLKIDWPSSIEVRKTSNNEKIGRLFIDGVDINAYVDSKKEDPNLAETLSKIGGIFTILQEHLKSIKPYSDIDYTQPISTKQLYKAIDDEYPLLRGIFAKLQDQIDESLKPFRPKGKGGRPKGSSNKPKKDPNVGAVLASTASSAVGGATTATTDEA